MNHPRINEASTLTPSATSRTRAVVAEYYYLIPTYRFPIMPKGKAIPVNIRSRRRWKARNPKMEGWPTHQKEDFSSMATKATEIAQQKKNGLS